MKKSLYISLKSGKEILINDFQYATYPAYAPAKPSIKVESFENFYLYDNLFTFIGLSDVLSINSKEIEFIKISG